MEASYCKCASSIFPEATKMPVPLGYKYLWTPQNGAQYASRGRARHSKLRPNPDMLDGNVLCRKNRVGDLYWGEDNYR